MKEAFFFIILSANDWKKVRDNSLHNSRLEALRANKFKIIYSTIIRFVTDQHILSTQANIAITFPNSVRKELMFLLTKPLYK